MTETLMRLQAVMDRTGCKRAKLYAMVAEGTFPKPVKFGGCVAWQSSKIDEWIAQVVAASEASAN